MEHTESQCKMIKEHLLSGGALTALDALYSCGCLRLGSRIHDLRKEGLPIEAKMVEINGI